VARSYSRAYLNHLFKANEALGGILLSLVNLSYYQELMQGMRAAITAGKFEAYSETVRTEWTARADMD
jgi:queuine tRNA-ribosyltransferase